MRKMKLALSGNGSDTKLIKINYDEAMKIVNKQEKQREKSEANSRRISKSISEGKYSGKRFLFSRKKLKPIGDVTFDEYGNLEYTYYININYHDSKRSYNNKIGKPSTWGSKYFGGRPNRTSRNKRHTRKAR